MSVVRVFGTKALGSSAGRAATQVRQLSVAEVQAANTVGKLGAANKATAGDVGNLFSQLKGVDSVMGEMQNSLPLAAGGFRAIGSAIVQILNPITLITAASFAAGAAMVGWFRSAGEEALTLEEVIGNLADGIDNYRTSVKNAGLDTDAMIERFGSGASEAQKYLKALIEVRRHEALTGAAQLKQKFTSETGGLYQDQSRFYIGNQFGLEGKEGMSKGSHPLVAELISAYEQLDAAADQSIEQQVGTYDNWVFRTYNQFENDYFRQIGQDNITVTNLGGDQDIVDTGDTIYRHDTLVAFTPDSQNYDAKIFTRGALDLTIAKLFTPFFDTGLVPFMAAIAFFLETDASAFRFYMYAYDAAGALITSEPTGLAGTIP